jgi:threonine 3-dehydrogenase
MTTLTPVAPSTTPNQPGRIPATMRALIKHHAGPELQFVANRPVPSIGKRDVLIRVSKVGICGTDRHIWEWDDWSASRIPVGIVTGHEFVGTIAAVGEAVTKYQPGLRVSAEGHVTSWTDFNSRTGNAHIAGDTRIIGIDRDGCFAEYVSVPEENVWPVHASIPDRIAAVMDPLGNAVHTVMAAGVSAKSVLITGTGIIGLMAVTVAKAAGAGRIFATDIDPRRRALARKLGASEVFDPRDNSWVAGLRKACRGEGADVLLEMSGAAPALEQGLESLRNGGTAALLGLFKRPAPNFDFNRLVIFKGLTLLGINGRKMFETWYQMEELLLSGKLELDEIVTHEFPLEDFKKAHETMISGEGIKVVMKVS